MSSGRDDVPPVLEEVRSRRVGKVVAAYLAFAFAAAEAATLPGLSLPEWAVRVILGALVLGFPVTVVLAWTYDITPTGVVRTPDDLSVVAPETKPRAWLVVTVLGVVIGAVLHLLRS